MTQDIFGTLLTGDAEVTARAFDKFSIQPVDCDLMEEEALPIRRHQTTLAETVTVQGPGTFLGDATRTLTLEPTDREGWWFDREDHPECLPVKVSIRNVWTTGAIVSNIVLRAGPPQNYIRLVEHIIALKLGFDIDNLLIRIDSGDPPLFNVGSMPIVEALESVGRREYEHPVRYVTVKEKVTVASPDGKFLIIEPPSPGRFALDVDCAVDFKSAIGRQRIVFPLNYKNFRHGAHARTNSTAKKKLYCQTIGKLFADVRNLGYTGENVLVAGRFRYINEAKLMHEGKSLEASWHRAILDLLAAVALIDDGIFVGKITSYKAGHSLDVEAVRELYKHELLTEIEPPPA